MSGQLVGREEELQALELFLAGALHQPRALVIEGEAGAGKTALWDAGLQLARRQGSCNLCARPTQAEANFAYAALGDLLRDQGDALRTLPARPRRSLEAALLVGDGDAEAPDARAVALGVLGIVERMSAQAPVVVAVDDVQWLDAPSAAVLTFVARRLGKRPVALLVSWRAQAGGPVPLELDRALGVDAVERLTPGPLSLGAVQRLLQQRLDHLPPRPALRRLHDLSGGNPFFALELGRAVQAGRLRLEPGERLPVALDELLGTRLQVLSPASRRSLAAAAALAQPTLALVAGVAGTGPDALDEAERADVILVRDGRISFTHPLLASAAYAACGPSERRDLHLAAGARAVDPEERARHLALAADGPDETVAAALEAAGAHADSRGAPAAAAELYTRAVRLTPSQRRADAVRRKRLAGFCTFRSGDGRRARELLDEVVEALDPGPERARALVSLARVRSYDDDLRAAESLLRQALEEAGGEADLQASAGEALASILFRLRERLDEAVDVAAAATVAARAAANEERLAEALQARLLAEATSGRAGDAAKTLEAVHALQERSTDRRTIAQPLFGMGVVWLWWDELDRARDAFGQLEARARDMGDEGSLPYILVMAAQVAAVRGELRVAAEHADEGYDLACQAGQETLAAYLLALRAVVHADAGELEQARQVGARARDAGVRTSGRPAEHFAVAALGRAELSSQRAEEAARVLGPLVTFLRAENIREPGTARVVPDQIEALIAVGRVDAAEELLAWFADNAARLDRASALAAAARCRGLLHAERGDLGLALEELERAVTMGADVPIPLERGRSLLALGAAHRRARHKRAARDALEQALQAFEAMGAAIWAERARTELLRVGGRRPSDEPGGLTATERRVATLAAEGLQTKQVAAALFMSPKTVEGHLTKIYAKLGVHSRTELARRIPSLPSEHA